MTWLKRGHLLYLSFNIDSLRSLTVIGVGSTLFVRPWSRTSRFCSYDESGSRIHEAAENGTNANPGWNRCFKYNTQSWSREIKINPLLNLNKTFIFLSTNGTRFLLTDQFFLNQYR